MVTEKRCCAGFIYFTRRNHQDELDNVFLYGFKTEAVEIKKQVSGSQSSSLVAVHERVVFQHTEQIGRRQIEDIRIAIGFLLQRTRKRWIKQTGIANTRCTTMQTQLLLMQRFYESPRMKVDH